MDALARRRCNARALSHALAPPYAGVVGALVVGRPTAVTHQQAMHDLKCVLREGQSNEDFILLPLLFAAAGHSPGTFVEIGAYDGSDGSQTHLLENCFGWSGVLIEASNRNYDKLTKNERRKPPTQKVYSAVCARGVGTVTVSNGGGTVAGVTSDMAGGFKRQWSKAHNDCGGFECTTKVPCKPLPDVMADAGFPRANFLSLDVEGGEARVMGTVLEVVGNSSENFPFDVVMAEADRHSARKNQWVRDMLKQVGMVQVPFMYSQGSYNDLFVRPHLVPFAKHLNRASAEVKDAWSIAAREPTLVPKLAKYPMSRYIGQLYNATKPQGLVLAARLQLGLTEHIDRLLHAEPHHEAHHGGSDGGQPKKLDKLETLAS